MSGQDTATLPPIRLPRSGRGLDPLERSSEIMFGLIMALTFSICSSRKWTSVPNPMRRLPPFDRCGSIERSIIPRHEDAAFALSSARLANSSLASMTRVTNEGSFMARLASMASPRLLNIAPLWPSSSSATSNGAIRAA
jgi:hypothetical protein